MSDHTKTPWHSNGDEIQAKSDGRYKLDMTLAIMSPLHADKSANAAFIVRAVNSHEALVAALRDCLTSEFPVTDKGAIEKAQAALKLAGAA